MQPRADDPMVQMPSRTTSDLLAGQRKLSSQLYDLSQKARISRTDRPGAAISGGSDGAEAIGIDFGPLGWVKEYVVNRMIFNRWLEFTH